MDQAKLIEVIEKAARDGVKRVDLSGEGITRLPEQIGQLVNLQELNVAGNRLRELPEQIGRLAGLVALDLAANRLTALPEQITRLLNLRRLDLDKNRLSGLPEQIGQLAKLEYLSIYSNQLTRLPEQIGQLINVQVLFLHANQLSELPEQIGQLAGLNWLAIDGNHLVRLPRSIGKLSQLERLDLGEVDSGDGNPLTALPMEMRNLTRLDILDVANCPGLNLPPEIVEKRESPQEILDYYFRTRTQPARPLNEAKVLVVGEAEVGKTSLIKQLLGIGKFDPLEDQTHTIVTHRWDLKMGDGGKRARRGRAAKGESDEDRTVRLNVWDFGGQEIMHATHQFFLTKRSLYLLVLDSRQNERQSRIEYWLKLIHSFGEDSPVIVVCNKCDQQLMQLDWKGLQTKYPQIKTFVRRVSCYVDKEKGEDRREGLDEIQEAIAKRIAGLEHVDTPFPQIWFDVKQSLEEMPDSYMPYDDYTALCADNGIAEDGEQRQLIGFLHDLGIVLHFHDHPILRDLNILNPLWVTTAVYRILTSERLTVAHGVLKFGELDKLLKAASEGGFTYPLKRQLWVIEMMRRFELLFDFEGKANKEFLVPGLLPLEQPDGVADGWDDALGFRYDYEVLPVSVISRFIVRMHQRLHDKLCWRKGVVLESLEGDVQARVQADFEDARIDIRIRGTVTGRRRFLQSIRDQFDAIHSSIPRLTVAEQVPLPDHPDVLVDYERLRLFEETGKTDDYEKVGDELVKISVTDLLAGVQHPPGLDVFISYSHADAKLLGEFTKMLSPMVRDGRITIWSDREIGASQNWREEIDRNLHMARSGLLLVSTGFLDSDFIRENELPYLLRARKERCARLFIAVLNSCMWEETPLAKIQFAHDAGEPLDSLRKAKRGAIIKSICEKLVEQL